MNLQESGQMYLETIYVLTGKSDKVRAKDVCEYMGFSKPSVSRALGLLKNGGYVEVSDEGYLTLTDEGIRVAKMIFERHNLITEVLIRLGVDRETASEDACKMEHVISEKTFDALKRYMDNI
ncbi:MAG: metal-dependent transcriptional regulator [Acutalibacteraceae bacterium]|nr:metal-dependent transcriptional regulator [Acutalibacteraceae bacterium]